MDETLYFLIGKTSYFLTYEVSHTLGEKYKQNKVERDTAHYASDTC